MKSHVILTAVVLLIIAVSAYEATATPGKGSVYCPTYAPIPYDSDGDGYYDICIGEPEPALATTSQQFSVEQCESDVVAFCAQRYGDDEFEYCANMMVQSCRDVQ